MLIAGPDGQQSGIRSFRPILALMWEKISDSRVSGAGGTPDWWACLTLSVCFPLRDAPSGPSFAPWCGSWHLLHRRDGPLLPSQLTVSPQHLTSPQLKHSSLLCADGLGLTAWGTAKGMSAPPLTSSIWPLSQTETGRTVSEERTLGTFSRRWVISARIACALARGRVAWCPGAFKVPCYDSKQWNHSQPWVLYSLPSPFPAWTSERTFQVGLGTFVCAHNMHVYTHIQAPTAHTHTHSHAHIHMHVSTCVHVNTHVHMKTYTRTHIHAMHSHIHMHLQTHTHTYTCTDIHVHTQAYTHIHPHIHMTI